MFRAFLFATRALIGFSGKKSSRGFFGLYGFCLGIGLLFLKAVALLEASLVLE